MGKLTNRLAHAWSAFSEPKKADNALTFQSYGQTVSYGGRPGRTRSNFASDRSIVSTIYNRIGIDVAAIEIKHVRLDQNGRFMETMVSGLNECLMVEANIDQAARAFRQDVAQTLFDKGIIAIVAVETTADPGISAGYDVKTLRVGEVVNWFPRYVTVNLYNDIKGKHEEVTLPKTQVAIVENPLYNVMNEPNSTLQRLIRKLSLLDSIDEQAGSGKLDLIIQLPYVVKSEAKRQQAEQRRKDVEVQLKGSQYGIAYTDGTEKVTQLNRPAENNMLKQIEYLTGMLYSQLGLTEEIFNGTADEKTMLNYHNRTVEPILAAITESLKRTFLTKTARTQKQSIEAYRDPFKLVSVAEMAEVADKFTRNEVLSANEIRGFMGIAPSTEAKADELRNSNMPAPLDSPEVPQETTDGEPAASDQEEANVMNDAFDELDKSVDDMIRELEGPDDT